VTLIKDAVRVRVCTDEQRLEQRWRLIEV